MSAERVGITFCRSRSSVYAAAVEIARAADDYREYQVDRAIAHTATWPLDLPGTDAALTLIRLVRGLAGTIISLDGQIIHGVYGFDDVLRCYQESMNCSDPRAHCHEIISDPYPTRPEWGMPEDMYVLPCKYLLRRGALRLSERTQVRAADQIQAAGVRMECYWCPNFRPEDFRHAGARFNGGEALWSTE